MICRLSRPFCAKKRCKQASKASLRLGHLRDRRIFCALSKVGNQSCKGVWFDDPLRFGYDDIWPKARAVLVWGD